MTLAAPVYYPDTEGQRLADTSAQLEFIAVIRWGAEAQFRDDPDVYVTEDRYICPAWLDDNTGVAPNVFLAFGRPRGSRSSYQVWREAGIFPQVVVDVWSPGNTPDEMRDKFDFYERYGADEYYPVSPDFPARVRGWVRSGERLQPISDMAAHVSPRLGWRFAVARGRLTVYGADGRPLQRPDDAMRRADRLAAKLRALGADPDAE